jgi:hypothetical protein
MKPANHNGFCPIFTGFLGAAFLSLSPENSSPRKFALIAMKSTGPPKKIKMAAPNPNASRPGINTNPRST